jgi:hypothetical protein
VILFDSYSDPNLPSKDNNPQLSPKQLHIEVETPVFLLGSELSGPVLIPFHISNISDREITLTYASATCGCVKVKNDRGETIDLDTQFVIGAQQQKHLLLEAKVNWQQGKNSPTLQFMEDGAEPVTHSVVFPITVYPRLEFEPKYISTLVSSEGKFQPSSFKITAICRSRSKEDCRPIGVPDDRYQFSSFEVDGSPSFENGIWTQRYATTVEFRNVLPVPEEDYHSTAIVRYNEREGDFESLPITIKCAFGMKVLPARSLDVYLDDSASTSQVFLISSRDQSTFSIDSIQTTEPRIELSFQKGVPKASHVIKVRIPEKNKKLGDIGISIHTDYVKEAHVRLLLHTRHIKEIMVPSVNQEAKSK